MKIMTFLAALILIMVAGCDIVNKDVSPSGVEARIYTLDNRPAVLNMAAISNGKDFRVIANSTTSYGSFQSIQDGKYLVFRPNNQFAGRSEDANFSIVDSNSKHVASLNLKAKSLDNSAPCEKLSGISDYIKIKAGTGPISIDLLDNDIFCGVGYNGGIIGEVALEGIETNDFVLTLGPGRQAFFNYTPKPGTSGKASLVYNLGINWIEGSGYDKVSSSEILANPTKYLEAFTTAMIEIEVTPE